MKKLKMKDKNFYGKNKGITLIALVITIIVLLILAGVSIAMLTGDNGILTQAQKAKNETKNAAANEANILNSYEDYLSQVTNGGFVESKGVNAPVLGENMELVTYNEQNGNWETNNSTSSYDYIAGEGAEDNTKSRWANAKVTIDGVDSYFVWIPRYAYKINYTDPNDISAGGTIDVKFLKGTSNIAADGTVCKYADDSTLNKETDYIIHPAFTSNVDLGGWRNELTGIWVGKYESSLVNKSDSSNIITSDRTIGDILLSENEDKAIAVQSNMSSWRNSTIGNMYNNARVYASNLNSHMLKNSEWGAVAYLTHSKYGRNGHKIAVNTNDRYLTANGDSVANNGQSSTGNVYGIYDLSGGAHEYVSTYLKDGDFSNSNTMATNGKSNEFSTVYLGDNMEKNYFHGDATYETQGWNNSSAYFIRFEDAFFRRGGAGNEVDPDIFRFSRGNGAIGGNCSFRVSLIV